jgi:hypothetical protein
MPYLHGFEESLNNQGIIRKHTVKVRILVVSIFYFAFFLNIDYILRGELKRMKTGAERGSFFFVN